MLTQAPKGTRDVLTTDSYKWQYIESVIRRVASLYGFSEMRTPVIEHTELFLRGVGDTTDIVQKEMYTFTDKGDRSISLKPEGTAGCVRAFVEHNLYAAAQPTKMYYLNCPVFRYENPQAGRLREHHQFGVEVFGSREPSIDAQIISAALNVFAALNVTGLELNINSIGCPECRPAYNKRLVEYFNARRDELCRDCSERLEKNPLRILDCKQESCRTIAAGAPKITDCLCEDCAAHFSKLQELLSGLGIEYRINPNIVRGLDYYTKTVFEIIATGIGAQGTVCGGGRYDGLVSQLGGPEMPGMGFGMGMERLLLVMESQGIDIPKPPLYDAFFCTYGDAARDAAFVLCDELRRAGVKCDCDHMARSMKAQFKYADKTGARFTVAMGDDELAADSYSLRDMSDGSEQKLSRRQLIDFLRNVKEGK